MATSVVKLGTVTPLQDGTSPSSALSAIPASQTSSPTACIDVCFNNATGYGKQGGCPGISGQYECICTFPALMQDFETCMSTSCALDNSTIQETLGNVQQICTSCTPDGCDTFSISATGGTVTFQDTFSASNSDLCYTTAQSAGFSSSGVAGFASVGPVHCGSSVSSETAAPFVGSAGVTLSDAAFPSDTSSTTGGAWSSRRPSFRVHGAISLAMALRTALVYPYHIAK
ncbi:hypothetical protein B0H12DRAFT_1234810 [Mycena haematopus]|nr:hypothetical protein B0H12DRAFT_1234810 [Mycena haematopus]